jgi:hypothetical protein
MTLAAQTANSPWFRPSGKVSVATSDTYPSGLASQHLPLDKVPEAE